MAEPREDVEALRDAEMIHLVLDAAGKASSTEHDLAHAALDALLARLEQTERRNADLTRDFNAMLVACSKAERERDEWRDEAHRCLREVEALASSEGEKKRVLVNTRTGERREWEPGLVLQAEGPLEWELREE